MFASEFEEEVGLLNKAAPISGEQIRVPLYGMFLCHIVTLSECCTHIVRVIRPIIIIFSKRRIWENVRTNGFAVQGAARAYDRGLESVTVVVREVVYF